MNRVREEVIVNREVGWPSLTGSDNEDLTYKG